MPTRIQVSSSDSGPANFTPSSNPYIYDPVDSPNTAKQRILHGADVHHKSAWDGRARTLTWQNNPVGGDYITDIETYFRSIEGEIRYFKFNDLDPMNDRWPTSDTWKKARITGITATYKPGGTIKYASFSVKIQPEQ